MSSFSDDDLTWLLGLLESEDLLEIEVGEADWSVRVSRASGPTALGYVFPPDSVASVDAQAQELPQDVVPLLAPMMGTFYRGPSPESPPYVEEGGHVERGDVVGLIEAMKVFNEIEAPVSGQVLKILVHNGESVQADQRLMLIRVGRPED
ncbi:MAG: acetyl-CoA carboxylase [Armatimonadetes bacterium]|nr:acetyl-CoA carboxylase [Armatimonadota bacterium]